jgi:hypothetical protein
VKRTAIARPGATDPLVWVDFHAAGPALWTRKSVADGGVGGSAWPRAKMRDVVPCSERALVVALTT